MTVQAHARVVLEVVQANVCPLVQAHVRKVVLTVVQVSVRTLVGAIAQPNVIGIVWTNVYPIVQANVRMVVGLVVRPSAEMKKSLKQNVALLCQSERLRTGTSLSEVQLVKNRLASYMM